MFPFSINFYQNFLTNSPSFLPILFCFLIQEKYKGKSSDGLSNEGFVGGVKIAPKLRLFSSRILHTFILRFNYVSCEKNLDI